MDFTYHQYDGTGRLTLIFADLSEEDALALIARVRGLHSVRDRSAAGGEVGSNTEPGDTGVSPELVSGAPRATGGEPAARTRKPRAKRGAVADEVVSEASEPAAKHSVDTPGAGLVDGANTATSKDPWGLVPPDEDPDTYKGADNDAAALVDGGARGDAAGERAPTVNPADHVAAVAPSWTREMIESKGRLRDIVQYLYLCDVLTPQAQAKLLNAMRDDIAILGRIPDKDMEDRIVIIMESLGILPESK